MRDAGARSLGSWQRLRLRYVARRPTPRPSTTVAGSRTSADRQLQVRELIIRTARTWLRASRLGHPEAERHLRLYASANLGAYWGVCARDFVAAGAPESWVSATALYEPLHPWRENPTRNDPYLANLHVPVLLHHYGGIAHAEAAVHKIAEAAARIPQVF